MTPDSPLSDEHLISRCLQGDQAAWGAVVTRHAGLVHRIARRSVRRRDEAEDLVQEVFVKVARILERYDRSLAFRPWLVQVTRNHLIDHHRSHRREKQSTMELDALPGDPAAREPRQDARLLQAERAAAIRIGLAELPEVLREAVVLRDVDGLDYGEIAEALGVPVGTVKSRINRGRVQLASALAGLREAL